MPLIIAPIAGPLSDRIGGRPLLVAGLAMQSAGLFWLVDVLRPGAAHGEIVPAFVLCGIGMSLFFVPVANVVMGAVRPQEEGVAVLGAIFSSQGSYVSIDAFNDGVRPAVLVGAAVVAVGALAGALIPRRRRPGKTPEPSVTAATAGTGLPERV